MDATVEPIEGSWDHDTTCSLDGRCSSVSEHSTVSENSDVKLTRVYKLLSIKYGNVLAMYTNEKYCFLFASVLSTY